MPEEKLIGRRNVLNDHVMDHTAEGNASEFTPGTPMRSIIDRWVTRRSMLKGSVALGVASFVGLHLAHKNGAEAQIPTDPVLNFDVVPTSDFDAVVMPPEHSAQVLYAYGDPIAAGLSPFSNSGTEPGLEFDQRAGDQHDGMYFFGIDANGAYDPTANNRGILCINHENIIQALMHANGPTTDANGNRIDVDEVRKEQRAHGVTCLEVVRDETTGQFSVVQDSPFNRRITALTPMVLKGPAAGSPLLQTKFSPAGTDGRGTLNNCANGFTPWGTFLTCEENYDLYFRDERGIGDAARQTPEVLGFANFLAGIGVREPGGLYGWGTLAGHPDEVDDEFGRFNVTPTGADATQDFRNEGNQYGYVVEIDPFDPTAAPRKRTALGRFAHEGAWLANVTPGQPVVVYMGDDDEFQYIYKFISAEAYNGPLPGEAPLDTGDRIMDAGTLYVARFDADAAGTQTGVWIPLTVDNPDVQAASAPGAQFAGLFDSLDSIIVHVRAASFAVGATPMDRPEWGAVNPDNGEVYFTLTNNSDRRAFDDADPAASAAGDEGSRDEVTEFLADREFGVVPTNPRGPSPDGHIIRLREDGDDPTAAGFAWEIFVFGSGLDGETNFSGLIADNEFTDCDGLWFDGAGLLWIQTDGGQPRGNNQMLAAIPGLVGDGGITAANNATNLRRFLVGPVGCEITGITMTPDRRSLFVNIQHPGESSDLTSDPATFLSNWPNPSGNATDAPIVGARARSATIVITRDDGGPVGTA
jgi:hypothetical protein